MQFREHGEAERNRKAISDVLMLPLIPIFAQVSEVGGIHPLKRATFTLLP